MTTLVKPRPTSKYSGEEIELGLRALVAFYGDASRASKALAREGCEIPPATLGQWRERTYRERYVDIYQELAPYLQSRVAERQEELVDAYTDLEWEAMAKVREELPHMEKDRVANALRNISTSKAIAFDKSRIARSLPTEIRRESADIVDLLRLLASPKYKGIVDVNTELIESTAEAVK